jgi:hypothetical protein
VKSPASIFNMIKPARQHPLRFIAKQGNFRPLFIFFTFRRSAAPHYADFSVRFAPVIPAKAGITACGTIKNGLSVFAGLVTATLIRTLTEYSQGNRTGAFEQPRLE